MVGFPEPLIYAVNERGLGLGATNLGFAISRSSLPPPASSARSPALAWAPEAASSYLFPQLIGRQNAAWILLSSQWIASAQAPTWAWPGTCEPNELLDVTHEHAETLAAQPISSLVPVKRCMTASVREEIAATRQRKNDRFAELMVGPANTEALTAFAKGAQARLHHSPQRLVADLAPLGRQLGTSGNFLAGIGGIERIQMDTVYCTDGLIRGQLRAPQNHTRQSEFVYPPSTDHR